MAKYCVQCGSPLEEGSSVCKKCNPVTVTVNSTPAPSQKGNGMAIAGLIISIVSFLLCCGSLSWLSLIFSIIGIVGANKVGGKGKGMAIAGTIISVLGIILVIVSILVTSIVGWNSITEMINTEWTDLANYQSDYDYNYDYE